MRIIIDLDESGGVVVERQESVEAGYPVSLAPLQSAGQALGNRIPAGPAISVIDAGPPPAWLLRALGVALVAPRAAPETWDGEDAGAARA
jgi:hypothetical protein